MLFHLNGLTLTRSASEQAEGDRKKEEVQTKNEECFCILFKALVLFRALIPETLTLQMHNIPTFFSPLFFIYLSCTLNCQNVFVTVGAE